MIDLKSIIEKNSELKEFYDFKIANLEPNTQYSKVTALIQFLDAINHKKAASLTKKDINLFLSNKTFSTLENSSKKLKIIHIKTFLKYYERPDLIELLPKYNIKEKELDKNTLINIEDLEMLLKTCENIRDKTLIIVLYESAIRRSELMNIKKKNIQYHEDYVNLYIEESKTKARNIPLVESIPFLKEYLNNSNFKDEDLIFALKHINELINTISDKCKKKFPKKYNKDLNPHLFRHSRLTELAENRKLNEPQLRKFAGWSKNSKMPSVYFHLDDSSIRNELISQNGKIEKKKEEKIELVRCPSCTEINNKYNEFCWKCKSDLNQKNANEEIKKLKAKIEDLEQFLVIIKERLKDKKKDFE